MKLLFLCTGNFYRSRFAEEYFNFLAKKKRLVHRADSRGLAIEFDLLENIGPLSSFAIQELVKLGVTMKTPIRYPKKLVRSDIEKYELFVGMDKKEHKPMIEKRAEFNGKKNIIYWNIKDLHEESPAKALLHCRKQVEILIQSIEKGELFLFNKNIKS